MAEKKIGNTPGNEPTGKELIITRLFNAPRELVFKAWTEPERLAQWWGPKGGTITVNKFELRPGGVFHYTMSGPPHNNTMWGKFIYREIAAPGKLVFVNCFADEKGNTIKAPFFEVWPLEILNTLTFEEKDGKTTLTLRGGPINATEAEQKMFDSMVTNMQGGFAGTFSELDKYLAEHKN